eukprot:TRINITY_DN3103_c0_g1_i1.p1 TRINITY_DN3103_c0_g1~~TRINITY_DN3103_c0_g1_i1.p1  ORF type:complete len:555 (+),score=126.06 TRINITY_DN3103_c0_g1_i1:209-1873(+)
MAGGGGPSNSTAGSESTPPPSNAIFFFVFVLIAISSQTVGLVLKKKLDFPLLTGFLINGIFAGPFVLGMLGEDEVEHLGFVFSICLGFIAFAAGGELYYPEIKGRIGSIIKITTVQTVSFLILGTIVVWQFAPVTSFMNDMDDSQKIGVALMTSVIFIARSPSSAIALINEMGAKGPFVQTALGVTMVTDVVVIVGFAIMLAIARTIFDPDATLSGELLTVLIGEVVVSIIVGLVASVILKRILRIQDTGLKHYLQRRHPKFFKAWWSRYLEGKVVTLRGLLCLGVGFCIFELGEFLKIEAHIHLESLLTCMVAAAVIVNSKKLRLPHRTINFRKRLHHALDAVAEGVYISFFTLVGLGLNITVVPSVIDVAVFFFVIRLVILGIGSYLGGRWSGDPSLHNKTSWLTYITQAGVALALTDQIKEEFQPWGEDYATAVISVLVIGQILGPLAFKWAVQRVGEAGHSEATTDADGNANRRIGMHVWWLEEDVSAHPSYSNLQAEDAAADETASDGLNADADKGRRLGDSYDDDGSKPVHHNRALNRNRTVVEQLDI